MDKNGSNEIVTTTRNEFEINVCQESGTIGIAVGVAKPSQGMRINVKAVEAALEHVHSSSDVILSTNVGHSFIVCEVPLSEDDEDIYVEEHVRAIVACMLSGVEDYLAETGETMLIPSMDSVTRDRELVGMLSD